MEKNRTALLVGLIAAVLVISVGFAAFANNLTIKATADVTPNASDFSVVFSNSSSSVSTNAVAPTKTPSTITATSATINNQTSPTLQNISVSFTEPGQKAEYNLYVYNAGQYLAYLNSVTFKGTKSCTPGTGADATLVSNACNSITMTVKVGNTTYSSTTNNITNKTLAAGAGEAVKVTIEYASNGARADGPFTVSFNDVSLYYATVSGINEPEPVLQSLTRYYSWSSYGSVSVGLPQDANTSLATANPNSYPVYLAFDSYDGETVEDAYACFVKDSTEYCLDPADTTGNINILETAFATEISSSTCSLNGFLECSGYIIYPDVVRIENNGLYCMLMDESNYGIDHFECESGEE